MQRHRQLDHTQSCAEMAAGLGDRVNRLVTQLAGKLFELLGRQVLEIAREVDAIEQGGLGNFRQEQLRTNVAKSGTKCLNWPDQRDLHQIRHGGQFGSGRAGSPNCYIGVCEGRGLKANQSTSRGSVPVGLPLASSVIFSTRASACRSSSSQRRFRASPRS